MADEIIPAVPDGGSPPAAEPTVAAAATPAAVPAPETAAAPPAAAEAPAAASEDELDDIAASYLNENGTGEDGKARVPAKPVEEHPTSNTQHPTPNGETAAPAEGTPAVEPEPATELAPKTFRLNPKRYEGERARDFAIVQMADSKGISLKAAEELLFGKVGEHPTPNTQHPTSNEQPAASAPVVDDGSAAIAAELETVRKQLVEAKNTFNYEKELELGDRRDELKEQLRAAKTSAAQRQQTAAADRSQAYTAAVDESIGRVLEDFPDAGKNGSVFAEAMAAEESRLREAKSALLNETDWPEVVAVRVAKRLGIGPVVKTEPEELPPAVAAAPAPAKPAAAAPVVAKAPVIAPKVPARTVPPAPAPGAASAAPASVSILSARGHKAALDGDWETVAEEALNAIGSRA